jgi:hypothetical protein
VAYSTAPAHQEQAVSSRLPNPMSVVPGGSQRELAPRYRKQLFRLGAGASALSVIGARGYGTIAHRSYPATCLTTTVTEPTLNLAVTQSKRGGTL